MYKTLDRCLCCGGRALLCYLDLGSQPAANSYRKPSQKPMRVAYLGVNPPGEAVFPLRVNVCRSCFHSQLSVAVQPELLYRNYLYVSGTTRTLKQHHRALAVDTVRRVQEHEGDEPRVLDLGCNDGSLMEQFQELRCAVWGVDPAENLGETARAKKLNVDTAYWTDFYARNHRQQDRYDIVTALNVVGHVADPRDFLRGIQRVLAPRGIAVVEFPYGRHILEQREWDQWYHEHHSEFLVSSFLRLAARSGLEIMDLQETPVHGGSIRFYLKRSSAGIVEFPELAEIKKIPVVQEYLDAEEAAGLRNVDRYLQFQEQVLVTCSELRRRLTDLQTVGGCRLYGYGASAKLNTVLNHTGLQLEGVFDDNPLKHGYVTPGQGVPIVSPQRLSATSSEPVAFVLGAWNFKDEIKQKLQALRPSMPGRKDYLITYVPDVRVEPLHD